MKPKVIRTQDDYQNALAHVDSLMDSQAGTAEEAELSQWALFLEKYEEKEFVIDPPDSGHQDG